jgi:hypothetical protein
VRDTTLKHGNGVYIGNQISSKTDGQNRSNADTLFAVSFPPSTFHTFEFIPRSQTVTGILPYRFWVSERIERKYRLSGRNAVGFFSRTDFFFLHPDVLREKQDSRTSVYSYPAVHISLQRTFPGSRN